MKDTIFHEGKIIKCTGDTIFVEIIQKAACGDCHAKSSCQMSEQKEKIIEVPITKNQNYREGEKVLLKGSTSMGLKAVWYAFVIPLLLVLLLIFLFLSFLKNEGLAALVAIFALLGYYLVLYFNRDKFAKKFVFELIKNDK
ncbi:SoxR reducing system RseC family protein [Bacteroidales bacterium OttesenSCG-928-M11]|nr:SoxR reducing system RseC family protein [Bacteroidales bacterium OttesenSCG-928-M11]